MSKQSKREKQNKALKSVVINEVKIQLPVEKLGELLEIVSEETMKKEKRQRESKKRKIKRKILEGKD